MSSHINKGYGSAESIGGGSGDNIPTVEEQIAEIMKQIPELSTFTPSCSFSKPLLQRFHEESQIINQMKENQAYLMDKKKVDWTKIVVNLPDIFINGYQNERFKFGADRFIRMINRKKYIDYLLNNINHKKYE